MTPSEYVERVEALIGDGDDAGALELAARVGPSLMDGLTAEEFWRVSGLLEGAELALSAADADMTRSLPDAPPSRSTA